MALHDVILVDMYVNPTTNLVEKMTCLTPFGLTERKGSDWQPTSWDEVGIEELSDDKVYRLDWSTDFVPMDSEEEEREHVAIDLFDKGTLTEDECKKYAKLRIDPTALDGNPAMVALAEKLKREGK